MVALSSFSSPMRVALVGASGGIGQAFLNNLLECQKVEAIHCLSRDKSMPRDDRVRSHSIDFQDESTIERAATEIDTALDLVIIATGLLHFEANGQKTGPEKTWRHFNDADASRTFLVNAFGPMMVMKHLAPKLARDRKSVIASLSARVGSISDNEIGGWYSYRAAKAALNQFIKCTSIELARKNANSICIGLHPGTVDTKLSKPFQSGVKENKLFTADFSAKSMLSVIDQRTAADTGRLFAWDGKEILP